MADVELPTRPADRVTCNGVLSCSVVPIEAPACGSLLGWNLVFAGETFTGTYQGDMSTEAAFESLKPVVALVEDQLSFAKNVPVTATVTHCAREWIQSEVVTEKASRGKDDLGAVDVRSTVVRQGAAYLAASANIAIDAVGPLLRKVGGRHDSCLRRLEAWYAESLKNAVSLVPNVEAMANLVAEEMKGLVIAGSIEKDIGFLANKADIGRYSRHPENHKTDDLPRDAAAWARTLARELIIRVRSLDGGTSMGVLDQGNCAAPRWIAERKERP